MHHERSDLTLAATISINGDETQQPSTVAAPAGAGAGQCLGTAGMPRAWASIPISKDHDARIDSIDGSIKRFISRIFSLFSSHSDRRSVVAPAGR